eukprot:Sdes_comp15480_c0_seq1m4399
MTSNLQSGFMSSPLTKSLLIISSSSTLLANFGPFRFGLFSLHLPSIFHGFQLWRILSYPFVYSTTSEFLLSSLLLYNFRVFERIYGSEKYFAFLVSSFLCSTLFHLLFVSLLSTSASTLVFSALFKTFGVSAVLPFNLEFYSGTYCFVIPLLLNYYHDIPWTERFSFVGVSFTDKFFNYLWALQLLFVSPPRSLLSSLCGLFAGFCYRFDFFGIKTNKPNIFTSFSRSLFHLFSPSPSPPNSSPSQTFFPTSRPQTLPQQQLVNQLVDMGFSRTQAEDALQRSNNNLDMATNILLDG